MNYSKRNRKSITMLITVLMLLVMLSACVQGSGIFVNKEFSETDMLTISKTAVDFENSMMLKSAGFGLQLIPEVSELRKDEKISFNVMPGYGITLRYNPSNLAEVIREAQLKDDAPTPEEMQKIVSENAPALCSIMRIPSKDDMVAEILQEVKDTYSHVDIITVRGNDTYYFAYNDDFSGFTLDETEKADVDVVATQFDTLKNSICMFPLGEDDFGGGERPTISDDINMNDFSAETLDGDSFTNDDLTEYDLTVVNIWTTWCTYCIEEMPDLQKLYSDMLPDNVNFITICGDANEEPELSRKIIERLECTFKTLVPDEKLQESLLNEVQAFPTTIFVDSKGNIVGDPQMGAPSADGEVADAYLQLINDRLSMVVDGQ
jgi:thiol-disulfide isomerase/thioredoxin